jgi:hypothetical protein
MNGFIPRGPRVGVALFATFSGFLANAFLSANRPQPELEGDGNVDAGLRDVERLVDKQRRALEALIERGKEWAGAATAVGFCLSALGT